MRVQVCECAGVRVCECAGQGVWVYVCDAGERVRVCGCAGVVSPSM